MSEVLSHKRNTLMGQDFDTNNLSISYYEKAYSSRYRTVYVY